MEEPSISKRVGQLMAHLDSGDPHVPQAARPWRARQVGLVEYVRAPDSVVVADQPHLRAVVVHRPDKRVLIDTCWNRRIGCGCGGHAWAELVLDGPADGLHACARARRGTRADRPDRRRGVDTREYLRQRLPDNEGADRREVERVSLNGCGGIRGTAGAAG